MDTNQIRTIMNHVFNSLTVSQIEILDLTAPMLKVRIVAEGYASKTIPQRVELLTTLLRSGSAELSQSYAISFEPLTPSEYTEWYVKRKGASSSGNSSGLAASEAP